MTFYAVVDRGKISGQELWNSDAYHDISSARESQKRHESLRRSWRELLRSYRQGCWRPYRMASKIFARECMELGWPHEAVYHSIIAGDAETGKRLGEFLLQYGNEQTLKLAASKWLECTNLRRMFANGCKILDSFSDAIPDTEFDGIFERLVRFAELPFENRNDQTVFSHAWNSLEQIADRLCESQAIRLWEVATAHPLWKVEMPQDKNQIVTGRDDMMKAIVRCVHVLPANKVAEAISQSLPLATERKQHTDYSYAISLLCHLVHYSDEESKESVRRKLYPSGVPLDAYRLQVAKHFGVEIKNKDSLSKDAENVAGRIKDQVRRLPVDAEVQQDAGTFGFYTH